MKGFEGQRGIITGGAAGIGRALASALLDAGATVLACDVDTEGLADFLAQDTTGRLGTTPLDVTDAQAVKTVVDDFAAQGGLDFMINNAGIAIGGEMLDLGDDDWEAVLNVNLRGVLHGVRAAYPIMVEQRRGHLVNVASISGLVPYALVIPYTTSKHAVVGMSLSLRAEAATYGVRVSVACPGRVKTQIWETPTVRGAWKKGMLDALPGGMPVERCARQILAGIRRNKGVITVTAEAKILSTLHRLSPRLSVGFHRLLATGARKLGRD